MRKPTTNNWFIAYNVIFKLNITEHAKLIYLYLCRLSDERGRCYPSGETICDACGIKSRTTVIKSIKELETAGLIKKNNRKRFYGGNSSNEYFILEQ